MKTECTPSWPPLSYHGVNNESNAQETYRPLHPIFVVTVTNTIFPAEQVGVIVVWSGQVLLNFGLCCRNISQTIRHASCYVDVAKVLLAT